MAPGRFKFAEGERVLCFHGPLIYEAKCVKTRVKDQKNQYLVHYAGWNKNWDEFVPENRILKYSEPNLQKQKELKEAHYANVQAKKQIKSDVKRRRAEAAAAAAAAAPERAEPGGAGRKREPSVSSVQSSEDGRRRRRLDTPEQAPKTVEDKKLVDSSSETASDTEGRKRGKQEQTVETEEQFLTKVEIKIKLPDELKPWLVDDWDFIIRQKKLYQLPARITVNQCIDEYVKLKNASKSSTPNKESAVIEVTEGLKEYFNVMLGTQLLYKFERVQYADILQSRKDVPLSDIYGPIHILRLLVKMGPMLTYTELDEKSIALLQLHIQDLLRYMVKNSERLFSTADYYVAPPEYHRRGM
ncbi:mortality factor 4-like protein 1 [Pollicipes pollicipes]|uniref:mortality factor 4-like protein 1 n=1 Tax=Pollicipes pollicipes TaxID=41117 RepID=UPI001885843D|nr:mortality factor 4-like protein 1 [Pollicipes pollicipes]